MIRKEILDKAKIRLDILEQWRIEEAEVMDFQGKPELMNLDSRKWFELFLEDYGWRFGYPDIVMSPDGVIVAEWGYTAKKNEDKELSTMKVSFDFDILHGTKDHTIIKVLLKK